MTEEETCYISGRVTIGVVAACIVILVLGLYCDHKTHADHLARFETLQYIPISILLPGEDLNTTSYRSADRSLDATLQLFMAENDTTLSLEAVTPKWNTMFSTILPPEYCDIHRPIYVYLNDITNLDPRFLLSWMIKCVGPNKTKWCYSDLTIDNILYSDDYELCSILPIPECSVSIIPQTMRAWGDCTTDVFNSKTTIPYLLAGIYSDLDRSLSRLDEPEHYDNLFIF